MTIISIIIWLLILVILVGVVIYAIDALGVPDPLNRYAKVVVVVLGCLFLVILLLDMVGSGPGLKLPSG